VLLLLLLLLMMMIHLLPKVLHMVGERSRSRHCSSTLTNNATHSRRNSQAIHIARLLLPLKVVLKQQSRPILQLWAQNSVCCSSSCLLQLI
jgi:hypothetical protein